MLRPVDGLRDRQSRSSCLWPSTIHCSKPSSCDNLEQDRRVISSGASVYTLIYGILQHENSVALCTGAQETKLLWARDSSFPSFTTHFLFLAWVDLTSLLQLFGKCLGITIFPWYLASEWRDEEIPWLQVCRPTERQSRLLSSKFQIP